MLEQVDSFFMACPGRSRTLNLLQKNALVEWKELCMLKAF